MVLSNDNTSRGPSSSRNANISLNYVHPTDHLSRPETGIRITAHRQSQAKSDSDTEPESHKHAVSRYYLNRDVSSDVSLLLEFISDGVEALLCRRNTFFAFVA